MPWDSDDEALPSALDTFRWHWLNLTSQQRLHFAGVCGLCMNPQGKTVGDYFPADVFDSDSLELRYRYGVRGDKCGFLRTDVLQKYPFPENIDGQVPPSIVWSAIARSYKLRFINEVLYICHPSDDSITADGVGKRGKHSGGLHLWAASVLDNELEWFLWQPVWFFKMAANYTRFGMLHNRFSISSSTRCKPLKNWRAKFLLYLMWPAGYILYLRDRVC